MNENQYNNMQSEGQNYNSTVQQSEPENTNSEETVSIGEIAKDVIIDYAKLRLKGACVGAYLCSIGMLIFQLFVPGMIMLAGAIVATPKLFGIKKVPDNLARILFKIGLALVVASLIMVKGW